MRMTLYDYCAERDELVLLTQWAPVEKQDADAKRGVLWQETEELAYLLAREVAAQWCVPRPNPGARDSGKPPDGLAGVSQRSYLEGRHLFQGGAAEVRLFPSAPGKSAPNGWNAVGGRWKNGNKMGPVSSNSRSGKS